MSIVAETLKDEIALQLSKRGRLTEKSWLRWGDKNRLSKSIKSLYLSDSGIAVDKMAVNIGSSPQFSRLYEKDIVESIIDFTLEYPNRKSLDKYFALREKQQKGSRISNKTDAEYEANDFSCLINSLKKELTDKEIVAEMQSLEENPKSYFGKLLINTHCAKDLFSQPVNAQKSIAKKIIQKLTVKKMATKKSSNAKKGGKRVVKSAKLKSHQKKFGQISQTAFDMAYADGQAGKSKGTPKNYFKAATKKVFK